MILPDEIGRVTRAKGGSVTHTFQITMTSRKDNTMKLAARAILAAWMLVGCQQAFAGLSLILTPGKRSNPVTDPTMPANQSWRVEFQLHDWVLPPASIGNSLLWDMGGLGASATVLSNNYLRLYDYHEPVSPSVCDIPLTGRSNVVVRLQRDAGAKLFTCEIWNTDGGNYGQSSQTISTLMPSTGTLGRFGGETTAQIGFYRLMASLLPLGSRPPVTASSGPTLANYTFDGDTLDRSGNHRDIVFPSATFGVTPNQGLASIPRTGNAPSWSTWVSLRAGFPATLDGSSSFSMADATDAVTYAWQQLSGPSTLRWSDRTAAKPVITGLVFGTYSVRLRVSDADGRQATQDLEFGAVATDDNGVVVHANPAADLIFGPMIAFGKNPWPFEDQMTLHSAQVRKPAIDSISPPGWGTNQAGTVSYFGSSATTPRQTQLASAVTATGTTLTLTDASKLDFSVLPTIIIVHGASIQPNEEMRICGAAGNVLTVCYDGRGWRAGQYEKVAAPQAWAAQSYVRQRLTKGVGTNFLSVLCPGPGEPGQVVTTAGTVSVTPGSTTLTGVGTSWNGNLESLRVRIQGTHAGQPFIFFSSIVKVGSATQITLGRPWPADADAGSSMAYSVLGTSLGFVRGWLRPDGTQGRFSVGVSSCESDTALYTDDIFSIFTDQVSQLWATSSGAWFSEFGPNYYDEVLAHYAGYYRSGYTLFRDNARKIGDYLPTAPDFDEGWIGMIPRRVGATGMVAAAVLDGRASNWYTIRNLANSAAIGPYSGGAILPPCDSDLREGAYGLSWIALAAMFDPVDSGDPNMPNQRSYWKALLTKALARDKSCKGPNNEFSAAYWAPSFTMNLTAGSATATGTGIAPAYCGYVSSGTIDVTNGLQSATGTGFAPNVKITVMGKKNGQPYLFYSTYTVLSSTSITMDSAYDGDSGTYTYQIESDIGFNAFAKDSNDHSTMNINYACKWIDSNTVQLDRPWQGATGAYQTYRSGEIGFGVQPFMLGMKVFAMKLASQAATGSTATDYAALASSSASWVLTEGFDPPTGGLSYARGFGPCEPRINPRLNCTYALDDESKRHARTLNAEAQNAIRVAYEANPTDTVRSFGDRFYGSQWGKLGGPYYDSVYLNALDSDSTWSYKWVGFLFGMGMAHQWPAVRIGGLQPAVMVSPSIAFNLGSTPGATAARVVVTQPSGSTNAFSCSSSPCTISADARQGAHWYTVQYLNAAGAVISVANPELLEVR